jgi:hypothetical protein
METRITPGWRHALPTACGNSRTCSPTPSQPGCRRFRSELALGLAPEFPGGTRNRRWGVFENDPDKEHYSRGRSAGGHSQRRWNGVN